MTLMITTGSILRFLNTVVGSWAFATGSMVGGFMCVFAFLAVTYLEHGGEQEEE